MRKRFHLLALMPFGNSRVRAVQRCPGGTADTSPTFQRRERGPMSLRPDGTAERKQPGVAIQPSLRDWAVFFGCLGVETPGYFHRSFRDRPLRNFRKPLLLACAVLPALA